jgi:hypothetical protein
MLVRVTCAGVLIGTARIDSPSGLAHAPLYPATGYPMVAAPAQALGDEVMHRPFWSPAEGDFADMVAARWQGESLALQDLTGRALVVNSLVVLEPPAVGGRHPVYLVADFRGGADVGSRIHERSTDGRSRTRPAA